MEQLGFLTIVGYLCRKKRKWDQPDESLVSAGVAVPGIFPLANMGYSPRPAVSSVAGAPLAFPFSNSNSNPLQVIQVPLQQHAAALLQKLVHVSLFFMKTWLLQFHVIDPCKRGRLLDDSNCVN